MCKCYGAINRWRINTLEAFACNFFKVYMLYMGQKGELQDCLVATYSRLYNKNTWMKIWNNYIYSTEKLAWRAETLEKLFLSMQNLKWHVLNFSNLSYAFKPCSLILHYCFCTLLCSEKNISCLVRSSLANYYFATDMMFLRYSTVCKVIVCCINRRGEI